MIMMLGYSFINPPRRLVSLSSLRNARATRTLATSSTIEKYVNVSAAETESKGAELAIKLGPKSGDFIMLMGPVGAGKSVFARGFIRQATGNLNLKVLSPTFLLEQEYPIIKNAKDSHHLLIHHFDLYRFTPEMTQIDASALDWYESVKSGVCLVEWPERIRNTALLPSKWHSVKIEFKGDDDNDNGRIIILEEHYKD